MEALELQLKRRDSLGLRGILALSVPNGFGSLGQSIGGRFPRGLVYVLQLPGACRKPFTFLPGPIHFAHPAIFGQAMRRFQRGSFCGGPLQCVGMGSLSSRQGVPQRQ